MKFINGTKRAKSVKFESADNLLGCSCGHCNRTEIEGSPYYSPKKYNFKYWPFECKPGQVAYVSRLDVAATDTSTFTVYTTDKLNEENVHYYTQASQTTPTNCFNMPGPTGFQSQYIVVKIVNTNVYDPCPISYGLEVKCKEVVSPTPHEVTPTPLPGPGPSSPTPRPGPSPYPPVPVDPTVFSCDGVLEYCTCNQQGVDFSISCGVDIPVLGTVGFNFALRPCDSPGELALSYSFAGATEDIFSIQSGDSTNIPVPGVNWDVPVIGHVGMVLNLATTGTHFDTLLFGVDACLGSGKCLSDYMESFPIDVIPEQKFGFEPYCEAAELQALQDSSISQNPWLYVGIVGGVLLLLLLLVFGYYRRRKNQRQRENVALEGNQPIDYQPPTLVQSLNS